ncbi:MAG: DUF4340 domain-containing protein [Candidatus Marinimicrobia bacterium]|jgi:hypothetical protein|nr:DUF4340 domain-containing protein [Candidatus Neomarinimicrobiota bacterium]MBT3630569.1 DUF4340 domain-containing protein [Candidatus Neomarinimicrobiota bacterium]MBT3823362.1 DUF4340 domain-containing protein [Candidatus Neomarinimicrobiota bacterium]MBT4131427.1 DUF4340 domain-containing protein [Candidatus Neomarinimicrobiota bacterium]MBT4295856.1 DUF4340 domain-containing protein [Candidatus Neomarinimicrobiota bacterium]
MKNNQTLYAAGFLGILALLYYLTQTGAVDTKSIDIHKFEFDKNEIAEIELNSSDVVLGFIQTNGNWSLDNYPVDTVKLNQFLDLISDLQIDRLVTLNPEKHSKYEVSDGGGVVLARTAGDQELLRLIIGKQGANYQETFVREMSEDEVYAVKANLSRYKTMTQNDFWDRSMTHLDVNQINHVQLKGEINYVLQREGPVWTYNGQQVDFEKVVNMLRPLENLKASNFASEIEVNNTFYQNMVLGFENGNQVKLTFHLKEANGALLLVKVSGNDKIFEYSKSGLNRYKKELANLLPDPPPAS